MPLLKARPLLLGDGKLYKIRFSDFFVNKNSLEIIL